MKNWILLARYSSRFIVKGHFLCGRLIPGLKPVQNRHPALGNKGYTTEYKTIRSRKDGMESGLHSEATFMVFLSFHFLPSLCQRLFNKAVTVRDFGTQHQILAWSSPARQDPAPRSVTDGSEVRPGRRWRARPDL